MSKKILSLIVIFGVVSGLMAATRPVSERSHLSLKSFDANHSTLEARTPTFTVGRVSFAQGEYDFLNTDLDGQFRIIGAPDLPTTSTFLAVPPSGDLHADYSYTTLRVETNIELAPFQPVQYEAVGRSGEFEIDQEIYGRDAWFPESPVIVHERFQLRDLTLVTVEVSPFQYNPVTKELRIFEGLEVELVHDEALLPPQRPISRFFEPIYRSLAPNATLVLSQNYQAPSILYIYKNNSTVTTLLQALIDWRREKGFEVHTASTLTTGTSNSSIHSYIQNAFDTWENPPEFVTIIGDVTGTFGLPAYSHSGGSTDVPYVHLAGNDFVSDAFVGRISAETTGELANIIGKLLTYEKNPYMLDTSWYNKALLVGDPAHGSGLSTQMVNRYIDELSGQNGFENNIQVYSTGSWVSAISSGINSGVSFFNYRGWLGMSGWDNPNTESLTNGWKLPFVTILTCGTGSFSSGTSRSESFLRVGTSSVPKGAIAAVGTATSSTHTGYNNCVTGGIYHGIFSDKLFYAGAALERGRLNLNATYPTGADSHVEDFSAWNNLMGDAVTELWTGVPQQLQVEAPDQIPADALYLEVTVSDMSDNPLQGAWVSLTASNLLISGYSDADGSVVMELPPDLPSDLTLTVTKHDFKPNQMDISVGNENFAVLIDATGLTETVGNSDGYFNPGETAQFELTFSNHSDAAVSNVNITVTGENAAPAQYSYPSLDAAASVVLNNLTFSIPADYPGIAAYDVAIDISSDAGTYGDHRRFEIYAPYFQVSSLTEPGLPPHSFDPGEVANLVIYADNIGRLGSNNLTATLRSSDPNIEIIDSVAVFSDAEPGSITNNLASSFELDLNTQLTVGTQIPLQLEFTDDNGFVERVSILLPIGIPGIDDPTGPDAGGYFCYDSQDLAYALAPEYNWIEIVPGIGSYTGTLVPLNDNGENQEDIATVNLPFDFGFYGEDYNQISICSNGYIALGVSESALYRNYTVPGPLGPSPMIAAFWDDLVMGSGDVYTYSNMADHTFIIEYHNMQNAYSGDLEKFQVILYDADYYGSTDGNGDIKIQYHTYNNNNNPPASSYPPPHGRFSTTGLEDHTGQVGMQITFDNMWAETAHVITDESAIFFTTRTDAILPCPGWGRGDINNDGYRSVQDLVLLINVMLGNGEFGECEFWAADKSLDSLINVSDVVLLVNEIMGDQLARVSHSDGASADFIIRDGSLVLEASQPAQAFSFTLRSTTEPSILNVPGLHVASRESAEGLKVLGYWSGQAPKDLEILKSKDAHFEISHPQVADAAGVLMKSAIRVIPENFEIKSVYPNPFNPTVNISYSLPQAAEVAIQIYNALGQEVNTTKNQLQAGNHIFSWSGLDQNHHLVSSGIYFARITTTDASQMVKLTYLR
ncbi:MAG: T9SS type A sorting domain-containing protein [Candidatus Marinimicrobia bacterium]|nr:T9SS type A sorting domain-containing protein [Candidatus Neomarinimicrobiota bacterium]